MMSDLISRQDAVDALDKRFDDVPMELTVEILQLRRDLRERIPSAEPERKTGRWIPHPGGKFVGFPYMHYECNQCRDFEPEERNFCPNCGADMRGEKNEID